MADDFSRLWADDVDDLDAEAMNDLEARQEARAASLGGGIELGYVETTDFAGAGNFVTTSTATNGTVVDDLTVGVVVGARPILVRVFASVWYCNAGFGGALILYEDGSPHGILASCNGGATGTEVFQTLNGMRRRNPAAGSHTYALHAKCISAGTLTIVAGAGTAATNSPAALQVVEV